MSAAEPEQTFEEHLPGLSKMVKFSKPFQNYFRTDGVSVSLVMKAQPDEKRVRKRQRKAEDQPFLEPQLGQRVVGIDPGRRDMIACVAVLRTGWFTGQQWSGGSLSRSSQ